MVLCATVIKLNEIDHMARFRVFLSWKGSDTFFFFSFCREMENCGKCRKVPSLHENFPFNLGTTILIIIGIMGHFTPIALSASFPLDTLLTSKRTPFPSMTDVSTDDGYLEYQSGVRYDEYPIVVPKRAALILDRILKEIESSKDNQLINDWSPISRRGNNKDKLYFRCYFNAVSCYKRK